MSDSNGMCPLCGAPVRTTGSYAVGSETVRSDFEVGVCTGCDAYLKRPQSSGWMVLAQDESDV